jgi:enoyl-CoA hydratase
VRDRVVLETQYYEFPADGVALITLNRPEFGNAVVPETARDLGAALDDLEQDTGVRAAVLTDAGKVFRAGADLFALQAFLDDELETREEPLNARVFFPIVHRLAGSRLPFVAAINGAATAGGLDIALACDLRLASSRARLGETYVRLGLTAATGGSWTGGPPPRRTRPGRSDRAPSAARGRGDQERVAADVRGGSSGTAT